MNKIFGNSDLNKLYKPANSSVKNENGLVTIIAGSRLFHGPPLVALKVASRVVDMVFLSSPEPSIGKVAENLKSKLSSFIWIPWEDTADYVKKSDAVLIGPGFMRYGSEKDTHLQNIDYCDEFCRQSKKITQDFLTGYPDKKWVIDGGSLQVMKPEWIPENSIITANEKEYNYLFGSLDQSEASKKYKCVIVRKGRITTVSSADNFVEVHGGNAGLTKGATGDVQAGLTVALLSKNDPFLAAAAASFIIKMASDSLFSRVGFNYNADDLVDEIPQIMR
jgi:NAD(P)H-hydrate epimerase